MGSWLFLLGIIGVVASIAWWQNFYGRMTGQAPVECLYQLTGPCRMVSNVAELFGAAAYDARLLWTSGVVGISSKQPMQKQWPSAGENGSARKNFFLFPVLWDPNSKQS